MLSRRKLLASVAAAALLVIYNQQAFSTSHGKGPPLSALQQLVGAVPGSLNMMVWNNTWTFTDFQNSTTGSSFQDMSLTFANSSINITGLHDPGGTFTAQHLAEDITNSTHVINSPHGPQLEACSFIPMRIAVIAKAAERTRIVIGTFTSVDVNSNLSVGFDLAGGNTNYDNVVGTNMSLIGASMTALPFGYWLCKVDYAYNFLDANPANRNRQWGPQIFIDAGSGVAARNITYTGNGASGVNLWWWNMLPLASWSITNLALYDDFDTLGSIDINDTRKKGFKWYVHNIAPNSAYPTFDWQSNPPSAPTLASSLSLSSPSVLQINNTGNSQPSRWMSMIWTVACLDAGGFVGTAFGLPMVWDTSASWDSSLISRAADFGGLGPAFWGSAVEVLTNTNMTPTIDFFEWDIVDIGGTDGGLNQFNNNVTGTFQKLVMGGTGTMNLGTFRRSSGIWINSANNVFNSDWGYVCVFFNGQLMFNGDGAYNVSTGALQGSTKFAGNMDAAGLPQGEAQHIPVFWMTGTNTSANVGGGWPLQIDWVKIYSNNVLSS